MQKYAFPAGAGYEQADKIRRIKAAERKERIMWVMCYAGTAIAWLTLAGLWLGGVI